MTKFYQKEKTIGNGTFGNVWLVKSKISSNLFVMKEINLSSMSSSEVQQALTEVTVLSKCRHRHIIKYKDATIDHKKGMLSIVMEYAENGDLYSAILKQEGTPFKEKVVITWFTQISLALQYIHHKGILHRDLKTRNIFLTSDQQIKVGDFGIARCLMETDELAMTAIGTPYYLSPEICKRQPYNHKSDIWSLGCVLFEIAALSHPFQACNFPHLLTLILTGKRKELPGHCTLLERDLIELLLKENPEDRPSADEILELPSLQPYLSEIWLQQNRDTSSSMTKFFNEKMWIRRLSSDAVETNADEISSERRASVSSIESRTPKSRFGFMSRAKNARGQKLLSRCRSDSVKEPQNSPKPIKAEHSSTYKVLHPVSLKRTITLNSADFPEVKRSDSSSKSKTRSNSKSYDESDCGYQSEEKIFKQPSGKRVDVDASLSWAKTSTKKHIDAPSFKMDLSVIADDNVFDSSSDPSKKISLEDMTASGNSECCHGQCQQCMLDILWNNRIRGVMRPVDHSERRSELVRKLKDVFGEGLFNKVYNVMVSNWESRGRGNSPKSLQSLTTSLNYSQLQHIPLMMQLIQIDCVPK